MTENEQKDLTARMLAGEDVRMEIKELAETCEKNAEARKKLAELATIEGLVSLGLESKERRSAFVRKVDDLIAEASREQFTEGVMQRLLWRRWWHRGLAAAAAFAVVALLASLWWPRGSATLAHLQRLETVTWSQNARVLQPDAELSVGSRIQIERGLMEVSLQEKGNMLVEGPADLEFVADDRAVLRSGRIVLHVTKQGHGYRVDTPQGTLVDLGTQFGVTVSKSGVMETHVLEGAVEAIPKAGGAKMLLEKGNAVRFAGGDAESLKADPDIFYTALPPQRTSRPNYVHWSMDSAEGMTFPARAQGFEGIPNELRLSAMDAGTPPARTSGVFGGGLSFDGIGGYAESDFPGIGGTQSRTVVCWVKVPEDFSVRNGFGVVSWGHFSRKGSVWQVSINPLAEEGATGRVRVGTHGGWIVGTTDLRDGKWHHVAAVMYGGERPDIGTHVLVYIDGELELLSRKALREIDTQLDGAQHGVWLGRNIAHRDAVPAIAHGGFFRGEIDEVFICDAALAQDEIRRLMNENLPPGM